MKAEIYDLLLKIPHDEQCTVKIEDKKFRCKCGCNVFGRFNRFREIYRCNACWVLYESELVDYKDIDFD